MTLQPCTSSGKLSVLRSCAAAALCAVLAMPAWAEEESAEIPLQEEEVVLEYPQTPAPPRQLEVRRALLADDDLFDSRPQRRQLSAEERSALHLELRRALRSAYGSDGDAPH